MAVSGGFSSPFGSFVDGLFTGAQDANTLLESREKLRQQYATNQAAADARDQALQQNAWNNWYNTQGPNAGMLPSLVDTTGTNALPPPGGDADQSGLPGGYDPNTYLGSDAAPGSTVGTGLGYNNPKAERVAYYKQYMLSKGLNPDALLGWIGPEGLNEFSGDRDTAGNPHSFGDFQLNDKYMGKDAIASGIDITNPDNWQAMGRFAIDRAAEHIGNVNWFNSQWHGPANKYGPAIGSLLYSPYKGGPIAPYTAPAPGGGTQPGIPAPPSPAQQTTTTALPTTPGTTTSAPSTPEGGPTYTTPIQPAQTSATGQDNAGMYSIPNLSANAPNQPVMYGDSHAYHYMRYSNPGTYAGTMGADPGRDTFPTGVPGRNTGQVLARLNAQPDDGSLNGHPIVISSGAANEYGPQAGKNAPGTELTDAQLANVQAQIDRAKKLNRNGRVVLMGVGDTPGSEGGYRFDTTKVNPQLEALAKKTGVEFGGPLKGAYVHPRNPNTYYKQHPLGTTALTTTNQQSSVIPTN
jgi:hypothetical protein